MGMSPFQRKCAATLPVIVLGGLTLAGADDAVDAALDSARGNADAGASAANRTGTEARIEIDASGKTRADAGVGGAASDRGNDASTAAAARVPADATVDAHEAAKEDDASSDGPAAEEASANAPAPNVPVRIILPVPLSRRLRD